MRFLKHITVTFLAMTLLIPFVLRSLSAGQAESAERTPLDPQFLEVVDQLKRMGGKPIESLTPAEARKQPTVADAVKQVARQTNRPASETVAQVESRLITQGKHTVPVRIYHPAGEGPFPVAVYFHGGGWVIGDLDTYDASARALAHYAPAVVVSVDYRQAPEYQFPAAHEDALAATQWVLENAVQINGTRDKVSVVGEGAGANLATSSCLMARDRRLRMPAFQILIYPVTAYAANTPSYRDSASGPILTRARMSWFARNYLRTESDKTNQYAAPLSARLNGSPPALVVTAGWDILRSEGIAYVRALTKAGVKVDHRNYPSLSHEFFGTGAVVDQAKEVQQMTGEALRIALGS